MAHMLVVPDKFRSTATARAVAAACAAGARSCAWSAAELPLSDGGEGFLDAMSAGVAGVVVTSRVTGPGGEPITAPWLLGVDRSGVSTAVIELANVCGLELAGGKDRNDPVAATTAGIGELLLEASARGASRVIVGCGGSATTDGGFDMLEAIGDVAALARLEIVAATDVNTRFLDAARLFGPQKGADETTVKLLSDRLEQLASSYLHDFGIDVRGIDGSGAAGGIGGGLLVLGATIASGFDLVAEIVGLDEELERSDLVITGEGQLDATSMAGKVVGRVIAKCAGKTPVWVIAGRIDPSWSALPHNVVAVDLVERFGERHALGETTALIEQVVFELLRASEGERR